jgi:hypothetical protein
MHDFYQNSMTRDVKWTADLILGTPVKVANNFTQMDRRQWNLLIHE